MKCGKCNIGTIEYKQKGIYFWYACNNCDHKTDKEVKRGEENIYKRGKYV